jgi:hypothetical protein
MGISPLGVYQMGEAQARSLIQIGIHRGEGTFVAVLGRRIVQLQLQWQLGPIQAATGSRASDKGRLSAITVSTAAPFSQ